MLYVVHTIECCCKHAKTGMCVEVRGQLSKVFSPSTMDSGLELRSSGLHEQVPLPAEPSQNGPIVIFLNDITIVVIVDFPYNPVSHFKDVNDPVCKAWDPKAQW